MVMEILHGASPADIPVVLKGESQYCFDYRILRKYDIDPSLMPRGTVILNKAQTFFRKIQKDYGFLYFCSLSYACAY